MHKSIYQRVRLINRSLLLIKKRDWQLPVSKINSICLPYIIFKFVSSFSVTGYRFNIHFCILNVHFFRFKVHFFLLHNSLLSLQSPLYLHSQVHLCEDFDYKAHCPRSGAGFWETIQDILLFREYLFTGSYSSHKQVYFWNTTHFSHYLC